MRYTLIYFDDDGIKKRYKDKFKDKEEAINFFNLMVECYETYGTNYISKIELYNKRGTIVEWTRNNGVKYTDGGE